MTTPTATREIPNAHQRTLIASRAMVTPRTVLRCYTGKPVRSTVAHRVLAAAQELQLAKPQIVIAP